MVWLPFREAVEPPLFVPVFRDRVFDFWPIIAKIPDYGLQKTARADILRLQHEAVLPLLPENPDSVWKIERGALLRALES